MDSHIRVWDIEKDVPSQDGSGPAVVTQPLREMDCGPVETWQIAVHPNAPTSAASLPSTPSPNSTALVATTGQSGHVSIWNMEDAKKVMDLDTQTSKFSMSIDYVRS